MRGHFLPLGDDRVGLRSSTCSATWRCSAGTTASPAFRRSRVRLRALESGRHYLLPDLAGRARALWATSQPPRLPAGPRDPRAARRLDMMAEAFGVNAARMKIVVFRLRGAARVRLGLALRAPAALREPDAVRHEPGHRIPVHGRGRRRRQRLGRRDRRDADHAAKQVLQDIAAEAARTQTATSSSSCSAF